MERRGRPSSVYKLGLCLSLVTRLLLIAQTIQGLYHHQSNYPYTAAAAAAAANSKLCCSCALSQSNQTLYCSYIDSHITAAAAAAAAATVPCYVIATG